MVLSLAAVLSCLTLALDIGWALVVARQSQTLVDSAALAAVSKAHEAVGAATSVCGENVQCQEASPSCPDQGNLAAGCRYMSANGLASGQQLTIAAGTTPHAPAVNDVPVSYWVQVTSKHDLPRWFSSLFSPNGLSVSTRATAALQTVAASGAMYLLNRSTDCFASLLGLGLVCGEDLLMLGGNTIDSERPIYMASANKDGVGLPKVAAATVVGLATVNAPRTSLLGTGGISTIGAVNWNSEPKNGFPDGDYFHDPMEGKGQPPAPQGLVDRPVPGGVIVGSLSAAAPLVLPPGNYYAATPALPLLPSKATGVPIAITGNVTFSDGASPPCGGFCKYVFHGGIATATLGTIKFSPGEYVIAGSLPVAGAVGAGISIGLNSSMVDMTPLNGSEIGPPDDAGEIFIFTDSQYPGLQLPAAVGGGTLTLPQARAGIMAAGLGAKVVLHGLNGNHPALPANLRPFAPVLIWQDQGNSTLRYTDTGHIDRSCNGTCTNVLSVPGSQEMILLASGNGSTSGTHLFGTIYGPRLSWLTIVGLLPGDTVEGPLQIITGSLQMTLNSRLNLRQLPNPPTTVNAALIQ